MLKVKELFLILLYVALALIGTTLIKLGGHDEGRNLFQIAGISITQKLIIGVVFYGVSFLMYIVVLTQMQISLALPIASAVNSVAVVIIGLIIFHEQLNLGQMIGIGIVLVGVLVIGLFSK